MIPLFIHGLKDKILPLKKGKGKEAEGEKMATDLTGFTDGVTVLLRDYVFQSIIRGLEKDKGIKVTNDELFGFINVTKPGGGNFQLNPEMPYLGTNGNGNGTTASSSNGNGNGNGNRKSNKSQYNGPKCTYVFSKGDKKGLLCGAPCAPGNSKYCKPCSKKKAAGGQGTGNAANASGDQPAGKPANDTSAADGDVLDAAPIDGHPDLFRESKYNMLVKQDENGATYVFGVLTGADNEIGKLRKLNDEEKRFCQGVGNIIFMDHKIGDPDQKGEAMKGGDQKGAELKKEPEKVKEVKKEPQVQTQSQGQGNPSLDEILKNLKK